MRAMTWPLGMGVGALAMLLVATAALAQDDGLRVSRKGHVFEMTDAEFRAAMSDYIGSDGPVRRARPADIPDIYGPGAVLNVGNVAMKITNFGCIGNNWPYLSSDPAGQWPGISGVEYLTAIGLAVGAVNPLASDPNSMRRVSYFTEWRPATMDPVDKIYKTYDGMLNGARFVDDDKDAAKYTDPWDKRAHYDEDFLDGHDNDLDGLVDEDFGALGQQEFTCVMRDDTPQAINATATEKHVPLGLECQQEAWAYSIPGFTDFNVIRWTIFNRSGHVLDSLVVGGVVDMDCGPTDKNYWQDDMDLGGYPSGTFPHQTLSTDLRLQGPDMRANATANDSALCTHYNITIHGFSIADDDGDNSKTLGIPSLLLVDMSPLDARRSSDEGSDGIPETERTAPRYVGFKSFRSYTGGTPYAQGGIPRTDQQRFESMVGAAIPTGVDAQGNITQLPGDQKGDQQEWWSCGPWRNVPDGGSVQVTIAFTVALGMYKDVKDWQRDFSAYQMMPETSPTAVVLKEAALGQLMSKYKNLANAYAIQVAADGAYEARPDWKDMLPDWHGRETPIHPKRGEPDVTAADCRDALSSGAGRTSRSTDPLETWFDFDCDYCTGVFNSKTGYGAFHRTWAAESPPPNPNVNVASNYNYTDNPNRVVPAGDNQITLAWDNLSEVTKDPKTAWFDCRGYRVWKAANWTRPVGSAGPSDDDWALLGEFRLFYYYDGERLVQANYDSTHACPKVFVPNYHYPPGSAECGQPGAEPASDGGCRAPATVDICLQAGDLWDHQTGQIIHPQAIDVSRDAAGDTIFESGCRAGRSPCVDEKRPHYPVGRYIYLDREVKNGFVYFYSVTAFDSTGLDSLHTKMELSGRRSAAEGDLVVPQAGVRSGKSVWVVPNPYRGYRNILARPSTWDLVPNGTDPTGTHIDFMGLPRGKWTIRIYTVSGDLVQTLHSEDPVNDSNRTPVTGSDGKVRPGFNRQQDNANDGQARWNLISRNGQDIVSGIYIFTVESDAGTQRGKFVVIR